MFSLLQLTAISLISLVLMSGCTPSKPKDEKKTRASSTQPTNTAATNQLPAIQGKNQANQDCRTPAHPLTQTGNQRATQECQILADHRANQNCAVEERRRRFHAQQCSRRGVTWSDQLANLESEQTRTTETETRREETRTSETTTPAEAGRQGEGSDPAPTAPATQPVTTVTPATPAVIAAAPSAATATRPAVAAAPSSETTVAPTTEVVAGAATPFQAHLNIRTSDLRLQAAEFARARALSGDQARTELETSLGLMSLDEQNAPQIQQNLSEDYKNITRNTISRIQECEPDLEGAACDLDNQQNLFHRFLERADQGQKATFYHLVQRQSRTNRQDQTSENKQIVFLYEIKGEADGSGGKLKTDKIESIKLNLLILKSADKKIQSMQEFQSLLQEQTTANRILQLVAQINMKQISYNLLLNRLVTANKVSLLFYKFERARDAKLLEIYNHLISTETGRPYANKEEMKADLKDVLKIAMQTHTRSAMLKTVEENTPQTRYNALFIRNLTTRLAEFANANADTKESIILFILKGLENSSEKMKQYCAIALRMMDVRGDNNVLNENQQYLTILEQLAANQIAGQDAELRAHLESKRSQLRLGESRSRTTAQPSARSGVPAHRAANDLPAETTTAADADAEGGEETAEPATAPRTSTTTPATTRTGVPAHRSANDL